MKTFKAQFVLLATLAGAGVGCANNRETPAPAPTPTAAASAAPETTSKRPMGSHASPGHPAAPEADDSTTLTGTVLQTMDVSPYTYVEIDTGKAHAWAAVPTAKLAKGEKVTLEHASLQQNFHSPSLNRDFAEIYFGTLAGQGGAAAPAPAGGDPHAGMPGMGPAGADPHAGGAATAAPVPTVIKIPKATGPDAKTVAEVITDGKSLTGKNVVIHGVVVKVNAGILGKTWVHMQDGSGSPDAKTHDILVTSQETPKVGDTVLAKGRVATNQDFGSGYSYPVLVENGQFVSDGAR